MTSLTIEDLTYERVAKTIDHSLLRPELTLDEVHEGCAVAARYEVASVCCRPTDVALCRDLLAGSDVLVGTVIGFPHGSHRTETKVFESVRAIGDGATELDMVINIGWLRSGEDERVEADIRAVTDVAHAARAIVKVILENAYLTKDEIVRGCQAVERAGAEYVKTSTGFAPSGATLEDLRLDARQRLAACQGQGGRWRADARRAHRGDGRGRRPLRRDAHGRDARRVPGPQGGRGRLTA